ncbi:hypothetical protein [Paraburkholderia dipogonis]|uniref:hypothetical protein n=1 Tax=Paraburkholderia dipogonis TaxID=1211383 RepID=UPI0038B7CC6B
MNQASPCCYAVFIAIGLLTTACSKTPATQEANEHSDVAAVANYDVLNEGLAERVRNVLHVPATGSTTQIFVTTTESGIGSVYRTHGPWLPYNDSSCQFSTPPKNGMPSVFTTYQISKSIAADVGLDSSLIQALASFDVKLSNASSFSFSILDAQLQVVSESNFKEGLAEPKCASALASAGDDLYVVRGYVSGKRAFSTTVDTSGLVKAGVKKIATFDISADGGKATLGITDTQPIEFLQILELVHAPATNPALTASASPAAPAPPPRPSAPAGTNGPSIIYIQQNTADNRSVGDKAKDILKKAGLPVANGVESLAKTPDRSIVKYFQDADQAGAEHVAELLGAQYGKVDAIRAKAPNVKAGQLEVWLAKQ